MALTISGSESQPEQIDRVLAQNLLFVFPGNLGACRNGSGDLAGLRGIPMGRIGGEDKAFAAEKFHRPFEQAILERLAANVNALIKNLGWLSLLPRYEMRQLFEMFVHPGDPPRHLRG